MEKISRQNHKLKIEVCVLSISVFLLVCYLTVPHLVQEMQEPTQEEIEAFYNTPLSCENHTNAYKDPELYDGKYYSDDEDYDMYFEVSENKIRVFGTYECITELTKKQLRILYPDETDIESVNESLEYENCVLYSQDNELDISMFGTMHFSPNDLRTAPIYGNTAQLPKREKSDIIGIWKDK